ncbi:MAG: DUF192 domain-containing protein [Firmicutes bacterium]|jgi:uncharacterized membrane protein (UPF0127 family)|nr:DUF192 domain-containing protein [Bacillota bacterium]
MRIVNTTRNTELCSSATLAVTFIRRLRGLMFEKEMPPGHGLVLEPCRAIHTCFMRFPIDAVFISRDWRVVRVERSLAPWRFVPGVRGSFRVLELPCGSVGESLTRAGDALRTMPDQGNAEAEVEDTR